MLLWAHLLFCIEAAWVRPHHPSTAPQSALLGAHSRDWRRKAEGFSSKLSKDTETLAPPIPAMLKTSCFTCKCYLRSNALCRHYDESTGDAAFQRQAQICPWRDISLGFALCSVVCKSLWNITDICCYRIYSAPGMFSKSFSLSKQDAFNLS